MRSVTLMHILEKHVLETPNKIAYTEIENGVVIQQVSYRQLCERVGKFASGLNHFDVVSKPIALVYQSSVDFVVAFLGSMAAGAIPLPCCSASRNNWKIRLESIFKDAKPALLVASNSMSDSLKQANDAEGIIPTVIDHDKIENSTNKSSNQSFLNPVQEIAFLQYSSGSTGEPKGIAITHDNIFHNLEAMSKRVQVDKNSCFVTWLPYFHDMGLIGTLLQPLYKGCQSVVTSPKQFLRSPLLWLKAVSDYQATHLSAPNFAYDYCVKKIKDNEKKSIDLSSVICAGNGAEPIRKEVLNKFANYFNDCGFKYECFCPVYGLAEATLFVAGGEVDERPRSIQCDSTQLEQGKIIEAKTDSTSIVSCGKVADGHSLVIVDPTTQQSVSESHVGEVWFSGPSVAKGYWNKFEVSQSTFGAKLEGRESSRYLKTGDLGFLRDRNLYICGRIKDVIIIRGRNFYPHDLEYSTKTALDLDARYRTLAVGFQDDRLAIVQEVNRHKDENQLAAMAYSIKATIAEGFDIAVSRVYLVAKGTIQYTTSHKPRRKVIADKIENNCLSYIYLWNDTYCLDDIDKKQLNTLIKTIVDGSNRYDVRLSHLQDLLCLLSGQGEMEKCFAVKMTLLQAGLDSLSVAKIQQDVRDYLQVDLSLQRLLESSIDEISNIIIAELDLVALKLSEQCSQEFNEVLTI